MIGSLQAEPLRRGYLDGSLTPEVVLAEVLGRIRARGDDAVWIHVIDPEVTLAAARELPERFPGPDLPPLYGLPFAVKDNIDVADLPTTAACPEFAYIPRVSAPAVQRALDAGAILVGKTNLDQFATGLSGTRSPYGIVRNPYVPDLIAGGSSSGSAAAVATGLVCFALGTDTAGSGRVPAGLTGTVGVKPSPGLVSTRGIVPACRSLDCASVFALAVADGAAVLAVLAGQDPQDPYSKALPAPPALPAAVDLPRFRVGVPRGREMGADFSGDPEHAGAFEVAVRHLRDLGVQVVEVDLAPFVEAGTLLYQGPWLAERAIGLETFLAEHQDALHPVTREVLAGSGEVTGADVFRGIHRLAELRARTADVWAEMDALMVPTIPTTPTIERMLIDPINTNAVLGRYTNFVNLLDLAALAVPSVISPRGLPIGVTFLSQAGSDGLLLSLGVAWQAALDLPVDVAGHRLEPIGDTASTPVGVPITAPRGDETRLAVVGAHLAGQPLNVDLIRLGARLESLTHTADEYRLYALPHGPAQAARPGLVRFESNGAALEVEVYRMPIGALGRLMATVPAPLGIGTVRLADDSEVLGFICETAGTAGATDITEHGGWRDYLASLVASRTA